MQNSTYQNSLISKKQLRQLLASSFTTYNSMQACSLADELKYLGFQYASQAGISISIEDLRIPFIKTLMIEKANLEILTAEKIYLKGRITNVERFQKIIDTWSLTSESLKNQIVHYFKNYDPLNSVYIMAFSGARGNLSQVRQLVGMRGLMADPSGEILNLPIKKNFREGLTITDYLMSGYGARKGIVDTALKTANSGYLTRRLIDVSQDILIREKDCLTKHSILLNVVQKRLKSIDTVSEKLLGCVLNEQIRDPKNQILLAKSNTQITPDLIKIFETKKIEKFHIRSPLTCNLYRAICQKCYGWDLASENLVDIGEAIGIIAGQSIGEPGTQLTMRTFHTGGIFTSKTRQQITSPTAGIVRFSKSLKTVSLRTNRGEDVVISQSSGFIVLIPNTNTTDLIQIEILPNTILFPKNNQYITRDTVIGELIDTHRQFKVEIKPIVSAEAGEIFIPELKKRTNILNTDRLIWVLFGQLFHSPNSSFLNFHSDYKINSHSYVSRSKLITYHNGSVDNVNNKTSLSEGLINIKTSSYNIVKGRIRELEDSIKLKTHVLELSESNWLISIKQDNLLINSLQYSLDKQIGSLIENSYQTLVGGVVFYDNRTKFSENFENQSLLYFRKLSVNNFYQTVYYSTLIWIDEETYRIGTDSKPLLVDQGDFISSGFEITSDLFSKTSGLVSLRKKTVEVEVVSIKSGIVYEGQGFKTMTRQIYYPGERLFSNIISKNLVYCELSAEKDSNQLLVQPIKLYELAQRKNSDIRTQSSQNSFSNITLLSCKFKSYNSGQKIHSGKPINLVVERLLLSDNKQIHNNPKIEVQIDDKIQEINLKIKNQLQFTNYLVPTLRYKDLQPCILVQKMQFLSKYTLVGYLESIVDSSIEIVQIKIKKLHSKQILIISNNECVTVNKSNVSDKNVYGLVTAGPNVNHTGKIIIENSKTFTIQKGQPYFFPNCKDTKATIKSQLQYKILKNDSPQNLQVASQQINLQYFDIRNILSKKFVFSNKLGQFNKSSLIKFSTFFLKNNGKLYNCLTPHLSGKFQINSTYSQLHSEQLIYNKEQDLPTTEQDYSSEIIEEIDILNRSILLKNSEALVSNQKPGPTSKYQLSLLKFNQYPFTQSTKSVGLYAITEDYFEQDTNSIFCRDQEFIKNGKTLGFLNLEKEITGDIVQGLPRIEEILEARKKNLAFKNRPKNQKKTLLSQSSNLDSNFNFKKLGSPINENAKINPHKLLKVYFTYYGFNKPFLCSKTKTIRFARLINNYNGSYKSFKKVQLFILNSVQNVYKSQGVQINDKHLEVIIKQMTTKVLITYEGNAPLLRREVLELYHINYINKVLQSQMKEPAYYVPLLFGITKAALNNPSFMSAASFQETTRVLTKAAIEGRMDWLRGLKENIIIGHLIPAGTGGPNYRNEFQQKKKFLDIQLPVQVPKQIKA